LSGGSTPPSSITDAGVATLAEALPGSQVTTLDLGGHQIAGPLMQRVRGALRTNNNHALSYRY
jgi:hypothetical protein